MTRHKIWFALCSVGFTIALCLFIAGRFTKEDAVLGATKLLAPQGGTGQSTYATGDILIANSTGTLDKLSVGAASTILTSVSGAPAWSANVSSTNLLAVDATSTRWMGYTTASGSQLNANASTIGTLTVGNCIGCATISGQLQSTSTLQQTTNNGATTTNEVYLQGGMIAASSTLTGDVYIGGALKVASTTNAVLVGDGTDANQAYSFINEPSMGIHRVSAGILDIDAATQIRVMLGGGSQHVNFVSTYVAPTLSNTTDLGQSSNTWKDIYASGTILSVTATTTNLFSLNGTVNNLVSQSATLTGGTINGMTIGATTPALAVFTNTTSTSDFATSFKATSSTIATLNAGTLAANTLSWLTGVGIDTTSTSMFATSLKATSSTIATLAAGTFYADSSVTTYATTTKIFSTTASSTNLYTVNFTSSNSVITGGTMNGVTIGATLAAAANFTTLGASGLSTLAALTFTSGTSTGVFAMQTATATTMNVFNLYASGTIDLAAGRNITVAGVNPRKTITLSAAGGWPTALQGATTATKAEVSNGLNYWASGFQPSGSNHQQWNVPMPDGYDGGTMTCSFYLTATSTPSHTGGCFGIRGVAINDSSLLTTTFGASSTEVCVSHNWAANTQRVSSSTVLTIGNTPTGASNIWFDVFRNTDNASDTATNTLQLLNAECDYGTATYSD